MLGKLKVIIAGMAANGSYPDMRDWLREQGEQVSARGKVPARLSEKFYAVFPGARPAGSVALLPGPEEAWGDDGDFDVIGLLEPESDPEPPPPPRAYQAVPDEPEAPTVDSGPAHAGREWRKGAKNAPGGGRAAPPRRVTATVRTDISSKISLVLEVPGRVWQARDPVCGTVFVEQRPEIADALTEIVCGSPDLVAWFTGAGGRFMLYMNLVMACAPVASIVGAHHVYHSIEETPGDYQQPDYAGGQYAA